MLSLRDLVVRHSAPAEPAGAISRVRLVAIAAGLLATIGSSVSNVPHHLAYFNELAGGPENGHKHLLHSNLDWGQDLYYLRKLVEERGDNVTTFLLYYGGFHPEDLGFRYSLPNCPCSNRDATQPPALYVVSANYLHGESHRRVPNGQGVWENFDSLRFPRQIQSTDGWAVIGAGLRYAECGRPSHEIPESRFARSRSE